MGVFFLCGEMLKKFFRGGGCAGLDYFLKKWGVAQTGPTALLLSYAVMRQLLLFIIINSSIIQ